jgi:hypothetical protein
VIILIVRNGNYDGGSSQVFGFGFNLVNIVDIMITDEIRVLNN